MKTRKLLQSESMISNIILTVCVHILYYFSLSVILIVLSVYETAQYLKYYLVLIVLPIGPLLNPIIYRAPQIRKILRRFDKY